MLDLKGCLVTIDAMGCQKAPVKILSEKHADYVIAVLDVAFCEDSSRIRQGNAPQNFAVLRPIALNLLNQEKSSKIGIKTKRLKAGWSEDYLAQVVGLKI